MSRKNRKIDLPQPEGPRTLVGIFEKKKRAGVVWPVHRKSAFHSFLLDDAQAKGLNHGDIVRFVANKHHIEKIELIGHLDDDFIYGTIAQATRNLGREFDKKSLQHAQNATVPDTSQHEDLRHIPFVTIDGENAKDFDDAVYAEPKGHGWRLMVAIADVAYYVPVSSSLNKDAYLKANSVYLADRVLPMLPEALSNGMCSLRPNEDKASLVCDMEIDKKGHVIAYTFRRALVRSQARLTYTEMFAAHEGNISHNAAPLWNPHLQNLWKCFETLNHEINERGTLNLELDEYVISFDDGHGGVFINISDRNPSHKLIEAFMIAANVCAADCLLKADAQGIFRIHEPPNHLKVDSLKNFLEKLQIHDTSGRRSPAATPMALFEHYIDVAKGTPFESLVNELILRTQSQAKYAGKNIGHFGLNLKAYTHFTSPIRRYADLIVHRALIKVCKLGDGGWLYEPEELIDIAEHISATERLAIDAERETLERYCLDALEHKVGDICSATISGIGMAGLFVRIDGTPVDGFIPTRILPNDYYILEEDHHRYIGKRTKRIFQLGQNINVRIVDVEPIMQKIIIELIDDKPIKTKGKHTGKKEKRSTKVAKGSEKKPPRIRLKK